ncbi:MAG: 5'-3' exonuclease H3TH domain-containing protein [Polyangiaceae bacterium]
MRVHLVDGTFELYRAHFSKRPDLRAADGRDVKATLGVVDSLLTLTTDAREGVTHVAVAFDNPIRSFRNDLFDAYKSDEGVPDELRSQFDVVEAAVRALGIAVWSMNEFEADDALATGAAKYRDAVEQVRILTPDKDLGQCLVEGKVVQIDRIREKEITAASFEQSRGIPPHLMPDFLGLVGDTADGIPGLKGFGEKGAAALLRHYGPLERIPTDAWSDLALRGKDALLATFRTERELALLYKRLATLRTDVPLGELASIAYVPQAPDAIRSAFEKLGLPIPRRLRPAE